MKTSSINNMGDAVFDPLSWSRLAPYLDPALELDDAQRERWLVELAADQPNVAHTVRELLAERDALNVSGFLAISPLTGSPLEASRSVSLAGKQVGAYTLEKSIGFGGMGTVWLASRSDGRFEGHAAVKLLNAALVGHPSEQRFVREGNLLAKLQHPNVARLVDAGVTDYHQPYLILEHVEGVRIDLHCEQRQFDIRQRIELFLDVLAAVAHAHSHLIVHRDLKPSNILVTQAGVVKLLDFGVAALLASEESRPTDPNLTREIAPGLTPEFAAPEQLLNEPVTTATDVYALGLVLCVLLSGRHPLAAENSSPAEMIEAALHKDPVAPSALADGPQRAKLLRGDLDNIVAKALKKNADERYTTAELFAADLRRFLAGEPVTARVRTMRYRARKFVVRHRVGVLAAALIAATLGGAFTATKMQLTEARKQRESAVINARRAEAAKNFLQLVLGEFQSRGEPLTTKTLLDRSSELLKARYANQPIFVSEMLIDLADEYSDLMELNTATKLLADASGIAAAEHNNDLFAAANCMAAGLRAREGLIDDAQSNLASGIRALTDSNVNPETRARCSCADWDLQWALGNHDKAYEISREARTLLESTGRTHSTVYNDVLSRVATDLSYGGKVSAALPIFRLIVTNHAENGRDGTRRQLASQQNVAVALYRLGEVQEAYAVQSRTFEQLLKLQSADDLSVSFIVNTALDSNRMMRPDRSVDMLPAAVARAEKEKDLSFFRLASTELARSGLAQHRPRAEVDAPLKHLEAFRIMGKSVIVPSTRVLIEDVRAELELRDGEVGAADQRAAGLLADLAGAKSTLPRSLFLTHSLASRTALASGDPQRAFARARAALQIAEPIARTPDSSADVGDALVLEARALIAMSEPVSAYPLLQRAIECLSNGYGTEHPATRAAQALRTSLSTDMRTPR